MWKQAVDKMLRHFFQEGELQLTYPDGSTERYGDARTGLSVAATIHDEAVLRKLMLSPDLGLGEGYTDGTITLENDAIADLLILGIKNVKRGKQPWYRKPLTAAHHIARPLQQFNPMKRSHSNVAHHYDLSGALYDLFLDKDRQYSCAYFERPDMTLEQAQDAKKHHIAKKLMIEPGMRVLDIGCGWGGMGLTLARDYGAEVTGVTLSKEQLAIANQRAEKAGLADRAKFQLMDYRKVGGKFDRIVSVGMFEHVGVPHYKEYFRTVHKLLENDGISLIHTIGRADPPGTTSPWIAKYIFPGGYVPALSETMRAVESQDLWTTDVEIWRLHYAETLRHWYERFMDNIEKARDLYDERFCRMWRYYLLACELTFRHGKQCVFQLQLTPTQESVPLTRDYMYQKPAKAKKIAAE